MCGWKRTRFTFICMFVYLFTAFSGSEMSFANQYGENVHSVSSPNEPNARVTVYSKINYSRSNLDAGNKITGYHDAFKPNHVRGARIYDDFTVELDVTATAENEFLLRATPVDSLMAAPSPTEGWRCSHCHGFDYKGGIYTFQNGATPNLVDSLNTREINEKYIIDLLMFGLNIFDGTTHTIAHDYSLLLSIQAMVDVADFIVNEIYDVDQYIRKTNNESIVNHMPSMFIYKGAEEPLLDPVPAAVRVNGVNFTCTECHGIDGRLLANIDLYALSWTQPYQWLHRVNFGTPRSQATFPDILLEDATIHPGMYEILLTKGLHFGGARQTAELLEYVQTHFNPQPIP